MPTRIERDTFGPIEVPAEHLWGAQTQRSLEHFKISGTRLPGPLLRALALVKKAAALVNVELGVLDPKKDSIVQIPAADPFLTPLLSVIPLQLLAYHIAALRGCDVDQPRNLAKSVTVE